MALRDVDSFAGWNELGRRFVRSRTSHCLRVSTGAIVVVGLVPSPSPDISDVAYVEGNAKSGARGGYDARPDEALLRAGSGRTPTAREPAAAGASGEGGGGGLNVRGLPIFKPPYGRISAIDLDKGEILWQIAHGATPDNIRNNPLLKGMDIPRTGRPG